MMTMTDLFGYIASMMGALGVHNQGDAPLEGPRQSWQPSHIMIIRGPLTAADLSEIWTAAQRRRSERLRSLARGWL